MEKIIYIVLLFMTSINSLENEILMNSIIEFCKEHNFMTLSVHNVGTNMEVALQKHLSNADIRLKFTKNLDSLVSENAMIFYGPDFVEEPLQLMRYLSQRFIKSTLVVINQELWSLFISSLNGHSFYMNFYALSHLQNSSEVLEIIKLKGVPQTLILEKDSSLQIDLQGKPVLIAFTYTVCKNTTTSRPFTAVNFTQCENQQFIQYSQCGKMRIHTYRKKIHEINCYVYV